MGEHSLTHQVISLEGVLQVVSMDTDRDSHKHLLGTLNDLVLDLEQVRPLKSLKPEEIIVKVSLVVNFVLNSLSMLLVDLVDLLGQKRGLSAGDILVVVQLFCSLDHSVIGLLV